MDQAVLGTWRVLHLDVDFTTDACERSDEKVWRVPAELVTTILRPHRERVLHDEHPRRRRERGLEDHRPIEVPARALPGDDGTDRPMTGLVADKAREHRSAVEARHAQPVDGAVPADQRG